MVVRTSSSTNPFRSKSNAIRRTTSTITGRSCRSAVTQRAAMRMAQGQIRTVVADCPGNHGDLLSDDDPAASERKMEALLLHERNSTSPN